MTDTDLLKSAISAAYTSDLKAEIERLKESVVNLQALAQGSASRVHELEEATNGHTLENVRAFMELLPSGRDLEGLLVCDIDCGFTFNTKSIVEHVEGSNIKPGPYNVPCEVRDFEGEQWEESTLVAADLSRSHPRFCTFDEKEGCSDWDYCRIKKTDLKNGATV